jgi:Tol biopolymer transport system component
VIASARSRVRPPRLALAGFAAATAASLTLAFGPGSGQAAFPLAQNGKIAFVSTRDGGDDDIFVMNADGSNPVNLTPGSPATDRGADWSPDGRRIVFASQREGGDDDIFVMNADGSNLIQLTSLPDDEYSPDWTPDGKRIAFTVNPAAPGSQQHVFIMNADGTGQVDLTSTPAGAESFGPHVSADGTLIGFSSNRSGSFEVWIMNIDGSNPHSVSPGIGGSTGTLDFSPDGTRIAFANRPTGGDEDLYVANVDGTGRIQLTNTPAIAEFAPRFSPDGQSIIFVSDQGVANNDIFTMSPVAGAPATNLTPGSTANDRGPDWQALHTCGGRVANLVGTAGRDVIRGTNGPDVIVGLDGPDKLLGLGGKDRICGENGKDKLFGGARSDRLFGGKGKDTLVGGKGKDRLRGGKGKDKEKQ